MHIRYEGPNYLAEYQLVYIVSILDNISFSAQIFSNIFPQYLTKYLGYVAEYLVFRENISQYLLVLISLTMHIRYINLPNTQYLRFNYAYYFNTMYI